jgi:AcrR family transcriptional regulator
VRVQYERQYRSTVSRMRGTTQRQSELVDQLVALLLAEGFAHLTQDQLAARLRCSKSTLYALAGSREQLVRAAVVHFFRVATGRVEAQVAATAGARAQIAAYLRAVADELRPASEQFMADLDAFAPAREVYQRNTVLAARRVQQLIASGVASGELRDVHAAFVADVVASSMVRIQQRRVASATGLDDAQAYTELAALVLHGISA